jgi:MFS family permease
LSPLASSFSPKNTYSRLKRSISRFTLGGDWATNLTGEVKENLRWFWYDGLFTAASDNILLTYLVLYLLSLGATRTQIGLMSSFSSLSAALLLLPGALLVERLGHRKQISLIFGGGIVRIVILSLALLPIFLAGETLIFAAIALSVTREALINLSFPAWMSITGEIVPLRIRGRYFGSRNFIMGLAGMTTILIVGEWITRTEKPLGYQYAIAIAFLLGLASTYSFSRLKDPNDQPSTSTFASLSLPRAIHGMRQHPAFIAFCVTTLIWNFSINIAGPFFSVYMVQDLKATATMVGIASIVGNLIRLSVQQKAGELADRWGPRKVQLISMFLIPLVPALWAFTTAMWQVYLIEILAGITWGAYNLASFNFLLSLIPDDQRARYSAFYQITVTLSLAGGAALGSWVITQWGYPGIFLCSGIGRLMAALFFSRYVFPPTQSSDPELTQTKSRPSSMNNP